MLRNSSKDTTQVCLTPHPKGVCLDSPAVTRAVVVEDLRRVFGDTVAVDGASWAAETGQITCVLGPNGAGKTTTIECLEGLQQLGEPASGAHRPRSSARAGEPLPQARGPVAGDEPGPAVALVGTLINVAAGFGAIVLLGLKQPTWIAGAVYLAPLPYNIFLVLAAWRATECMPGESAFGYRTGALIWLALAVIL